MQDAEYQVYLKKQSYEDLLSIRSSLNKATYPGRYAQIIAEIDARDKLPAPTEKPQNKSEQIGKPRSRNSIFVISSLVGGAVAVLGLIHDGPYIAYYHGVPTIQYPESEIFLGGILFASSLFMWWRNVRQDDNDC